MNSKWPVLGMIVIGVFAALCVSVLVGALQARAQGDGSETNVPLTTIVVASKDLPVAQIVDADSVETKTLKRTDAPEGSLSDPVQVVGKVLEIPVLKGQAFTKTSFASEGSGIHLVSALPKGMRTVAISLADYSGLEGMLYPGSIVDVLVAEKAAGGRETVSKTLLRGIRVLGVESRTIVDPEGHESSGGRGMSRSKRMVTLMVTPPQAEKLHGAIRSGSISLSLRNPMDTAPGGGNSSGIIEVAEAPVQEQSVESPAPQAAPPAAVDSKPKAPPLERFVTLEVQGDKRQAVAYVKVNGRWIPEECE